MGVPKFYRWISERYPCLSDVVREYQIPEFDNLYLDMNGIIHNCSHPNDEDVHFRISEEKIFQDIFRYIEFLFRMIKPRKVFFMAIDGVAPRAKMNQQRGRRFRSAKEAETRELEAKQRGETLPEEKRFDSNCITPGTPFMDRLHQHLKYFVTNKITTDDLWRNVRVILSGHETPGEGEHKIMDFIRFEKSQPNYDPNTRHCLYGLDADLIMLGMCSHEPHFSLLREEVKYIKSKNDKNKRDSNPEAITFHLLHLSLFREYIGHEFSELKTTLSFEYNLENIIDDWVLMGFLVGNDFIPHIPHFHINKSSLLQLYSVYKKVLPTLDGYLNENGKLNLKRFQKYINELTNIDIDHFNDVYADLKYFASKTGRKLFKRPLEDTSAVFETDGNAGNVCDVLPQKEVIDIESDDNESNDSEEIYESSDSDMFLEEFRIHKRDYYMSKLNYPEVDDQVLKEQAYEYIRAIQWNLHYYYNGCMSWSWYYPHHYAPYISDVKNFEDIDLEFDSGQPFRPFEQLLAVLPSASKDLLPNAFKSLVSNPNSQLIDYYPEDFETDMNEKQQAWEAVVLIPFIDEKRLLNAVRSLENNLSQDEKRRNTHGPHLVFTFSEEALQPFRSPNSALFPELIVNHAKCLALDMNGFRIAIEGIHKGLCDGVELDVYFPGFPTLQHISHDFQLKKEKVRVFQSASMGENMMLYIKNENVSDTEVVAKNYLNKIVFVNWPHLLEAKVTKVSDFENQYYMNRDHIVCEELEEKEYNDISARIKSYTIRYKERWGVVVGTTDIVLQVYPMTGRRYIPGVQGRVTLEKQWSSLPMYCPIQTVVKDLSIYDNHLQQFQTIEDMYPNGSKCFPIDNPYYGSMADVIDCTADEGLISVEVFPQLEPDLREIQERAKEIVYEHYYSNYVLAQRLGISPHLMSRITGTILVKHPNDNQRKVNIGLSLKFNKNNEEIPGFSIKRDENWLFSEKIFKAMEEYLTKYPFIFEKLSVCGNKDYFTVDDLIPGDNKSKTLEEIQNWLRGLPSAGEKRQKCNAEILDEFVVEAIEDVINTHIVFPKEMSSVVESYRPNQLFRPIHYLGYSLPDPKATYNLFDRVVNIRSGISVPLGSKGTIIGKHLDETNEVNTLFDVVFDEEFIGGIKLRCSAGKGYKLSPASLINITYGLKLSGKYEQFINSGQPLQSRTKHMSHPIRQNSHSREQNSAKFQFGYSFGQRMPRPRLQNMQNMSPFMNITAPKLIAHNMTAPNTRASISIQSLNHSKNSPFQSPKHETQKSEDFPPMEQLWSALSNMKANDNCLPKASFAEITASKRLPEKSILPESSQIKEQIHKNKSNPKVRTQKNFHENKRTDNSGQNKSSKNKIELIESFRNVLSTACERYYNNSKPIFETIENMTLKSIKLTLPDGHTFWAYINSFPTLEAAYESVSKEGLKAINQKFGANYQTGLRLLSSPSFVVPNQTSPNRPKIAESFLPRPPMNWIKTIPKPKTSQPVVRLDSNPEIPESFVEHNERILKELQKEKQNSSSKANINTSANKDRHIQPKKLFEPRNDNIVNAPFNQRSTQNRNNRKIQNDSINDNNSQRRQHTHNTSAGHSSAFDHQFVPLQVARNNQSHKHSTPPKKPQNPGPQRSTVIEIASNSSEEVEILTPESIVQLSKPSSASKDNTNDEIEILTPESLIAGSSATDSSGRRRHRRPRLGVNLS